jgi:hypothetical protein
MPIIKNSRAQAEAWEYFRTHGTHTAYHVRRWFFNWKIKVRHLRPLFVLLFGEPKK